MVMKLETRVGHYSRCLYRLDIHGGYPQPAPGEINNQTHLMKNKINLMTYLINETEKNSLIEHRKKVWYRLTKKY